LPVSSLALLKSDITGTKGVFPGTARGVYMDCTEWAHIFGSVHPLKTDAPFLIIEFLIVIKNITYTLWEVKMVPLLPM
jgi:hypothetical protein